MKQPLRHLTAPLIGVIAVAALSACGDDSENPDRAVDDTSAAESPSGGTEPDSSAPDSSTPDSSAPQSSQDGAGSEQAGPWRLVKLVDATAVGGSVEQTLTDVSTPKLLNAYTRQFQRAGMAQQLRRAAKGIDGSLGAAVVYVGCEVPGDVEIAEGRIAAAEVPKSQVQCFAPITTVALVEVSDPSLLAASGT